MTRIHRILPALLPVLLFASCGGGGGSAPAAPITLQVRIVLPADTVYTHAAVPFRVEIAGGTPDASRASCRRWT